MKRAVLAVMVLATFLSLVAAAQARSSSFPPQTACIETGYGDLAAMSIKSVTTLYDAYGATKVYQINGSYNYYDGFDYYPFPITGTGYYFGDWFHFSFSGTFNHSGWHTAVNIEGYAKPYFDGTLYAVATLGHDGSISQWSDSFDSINCDSHYIIDYNAKKSTSATSGSVAANMKARMQSSKDSQPQE